MTELQEIAPAFVAMAHRIVWATVGTVGPDGRPRTRILHPYWEWDGTTLTGVIATSPLSPKRRDLDRTPYVSVNYWAPDQDTCRADCRAEWILDEAGRQEVWTTFAEAPEPVGYDPAIIPVWKDGPLSPAFGCLRLAPFALRLMDGSLMLTGEGRLLTWRADA
ncbi:MAG TPA: pyridoxamine 5'-phosphate oxidase family protein [Acidimicrobiales bacterium]